MKCRLCNARVASDTDLCAHHLAEYRGMLDTKAQPKDWAKHSGVARPEGVKITTDSHERCRQAYEALSLRHGELVKYMANAENAKGQIVLHVRDANLMLIMGTMQGKLDAIRALAAKQAEDEGLWFIAETAPEAYLQAELRLLHAMIEGEKREAAMANLERKRPQEQNQGPKESQS